MAYTEMGVTQTDEYQETYDRFLEEYDAGKPMRDICADLLADRMEEFGENSGILHGVYYAIAKCQWMCGGVSDEILRKVQSIIDSGADLEFYRSLGAEDAMLKQRKRNLDRFYRNLRVPRKTVRLRKTPEKAYVPEPKIKSAAVIPFPEISAGYLLAYPAGEMWRACLVLDVRKTKEHGQSAYCFVWADTFETVPSMTVLMKKPGIPFGIVSGDAFPESIQIIGWVPPVTGIPGLIGYAYPMWRGFLGTPVKREQFYKDFPKQMCLNLETVFNRVNAIVNGNR